MMVAIPSGTHAFTNDEVARILGVSERTVTKWCESGHIHAARPAGQQQWFIARQELVDFCGRTGTPFVADGDEPTASIHPLPRDGQGRINLPALRDRMRATGKPTFNLFEFDLKQIVERAIVAESLLGEREPTP